MCRCRDTSFFKYFATGLEHKPVFDFLMDLLLLFVLSGVALAWGKRVYSRAMGMRRTTRHVLGDRVAPLGVVVRLPGAPDCREHDLRPLRRRGDS